MAKKTGGRKKQARVGRGVIRRQVSLFTMNGMLTLLREEARKLAQDVNKKGLNIIEGPKDLVTLANFLDSGLASVQKLSKDTCSGPNNPMNIEYEIPTPGKRRRR